MMRPAEILAKLKTMASRAGESLWERAGLAAKVLEDSQWIVETFDGDRKKAVEVLEADYFPEMSLAFPLNRLLTLIKKFPEKSQWQRCKYNVQALWLEHQEQIAKEKGDKPKRERTVTSKAQLEERDETIKDLQWTEKNLRSVQETLEKKCERLERENMELRSENAGLRGENKTLNRMIDNMREKVAA